MCPLAHGMMLTSVVPTGVICDPHQTAEGQPSRARVRLCRGHVSTCPQLGRLGVSPHWEPAACLPPSSAPSQHRPVSQEVTPHTHPPLLWAPLLSQELPTPSWARSAPRSQLSSRSGVQSAAGVCAVWWPAECCAVCCTGAPGPSRVGLEAAGQVEGSKGMRGAAHVLLVTVSCLLGLRTRVPCRLGLQECTAGGHSSHAVWAV